MTEVTFPKFRWFVLVSLVMVTASTAATMISPAPLIPTIFQSMHWDPGATVAATMVSFNFIMAFFALVGGFIADKIGVIRTWVFGLIVLMIGSILTPIIGNTIPGLVVVRIFHAAGTGPIMGSIALLCAQRFKYTERTYVAAFQGFSVSLGVSIGLVFSPFLLKMTGSWQSAFAWTSILPAIGLIFALIVLFGPKPPAVHESITKDSGSKESSADFRKALGYITIYILILMAFIDSWTQQAYLDLSAPFYASPVPLGLGLDPLVAGAKLMWASYGMMAGTLVAPFITEKIFKGKANPTVFFGLLIAAMFVFTFRFLTPTTSVLLVLAPIGTLFFSSFVNPTVFGFIAKNYPETIAGRVGGLVMGLSVFGASVGVMVGAILLHTYNSYHPAMNVIVGLCITGAIAVLFLRKPKGFDVEAKHKQSFIA